MGVALEADSGGEVLLEADDSDVWVPVERCCCVQVPLWWRVVPLVFVEYIAYTLALSAMPALQAQAFGSSEFLVVGLTSGIGGFLSFVGTPMLGRVSDRVGRKGPLFVSTLVTLLPLSVLAFYRNLVLYQALTAASGLLQASFALSFAYVTDLTGPGRARARGIGFIVATFGASFVVGPVASVFLLQAFNLSGPLYAVVALLGLNLLYLIFGIPESTTLRKKSAEEEGKGEEWAGEKRGGEEWAGEKRTGEEWSEAAEEGETEHYDDTSHHHSTPTPSHPHSSPHSSPPSPLPAPNTCCSSPFLSFCPTWREVNPLETFRPLMQSRSLLLLGLVCFFINLSEQGLVSLILQFLQQRFSFQPKDITIFAVAFGLLMAVSQALLLPLVLRCLSARTVMIVSGLFNALHVSLYAVIPPSISWAPYAILVLAALSFLAFPTLTKYATVLVPHSQQGQVLGAITGIRALTNGFGPIMFGSILSATCPRPATGGIQCASAFFAGSTSVLIAVAIACCLPYKEEESAEEVQRDRVLSGTAEEGDVTEWQRHIRHKQEPHQTTQHIILSKPLIEQDDLAIQ